jgi:hypothetical protein
VARGDKAGPHIDQEVRLYSGGGSVQLAKCFSTDRGPVSISTRLRKSNLSLSWSRRGFLFLRIGVSHSTPCRSSNATRAWARRALLPDQFAKPALDQVWDRAAIIHSGGSQAAGAHLALSVDEQMELEAVEPLNRIFATLCQPGQHTMVLDAAVMTDDQLGGIAKREAMASTATGLQLRRQRDQDRRDQFDQALVTDQQRRTAVASV